MPGKLILATALLAIIAVHTTFAAKVNEWPHRQTLSDEEAAFRAKLGIPPEATRVLILSQSSHMDWDWTSTFPDYYSDEVNLVLTDATNFMYQHYNDTIPYLYSVAETGFLQRFWQTNPQLLANLKAVGNNLNIVGGGITSPDNIVCNGETLLRNYLYGLKQLKAVGLPRFLLTWIPDDFGHDAQFPIAMSALGLAGTSFSRVPGAPNQGSNNRNPIDGSPSVNTQLLKTGVDFIWQANDGSTTFAHYMQDHYCQGDDIDQGTSGPCSSYGSGSNLQSVNSKIAGYINKNGPNSPTPYIFVPIGCDFQRPKQCLLDFAKGWDNSNYLNGQYKGVYVVAATFPDYYNLVMSYYKSHSSSVKTHKMDAFPYWTGFYLSRPGNKINQEKAIRLLQAAEFLTFIDPAGNTRITYRNLDQAFAYLTPSTHHDFITGTAVDDTYLGEQVVYLKAAVDLAQQAIDFELEHIVSWLRVPLGNGEIGVAVFNSLGFNRNQSTLVFTSPATDIQSITFDNQAYYPLQQIAPETYATHIPFVPSLGWIVGKLSTSPATARSQVYINSAAGGQYTMGNQYVSATISQSANWGIISLRDLLGNMELLGSQGAANLAFYQDDGNIYRFGNEMANCGWSLDSTIKVTALPLAPGAIVSGPAYASLTTVVNVNLGPVSYQYVRTYSLGATDKAIKVEVTGAAPPYYSVFTRIGYNSPVSALQYGTPLHWDTTLPVKYWQGLNFMSTHHFLRASNGSQALGQIYSAAMHAWAIDADGSLLGGLFRNSPGGNCEGYGADGTDTAIHTQTFFLRVPTGTKDASSGEPMRESMHYTTPLILGSGIPNGAAFITQFSMASVVDPQSPSFLTTAKGADDNKSTLILRVYNPTNKPTQVNVKTYLQNVGAKTTTLVTALEDTPEARPGVSLSFSNLPNSAQFAVSTNYALTTVAIQQ